MKTIVTEQVKSNKDIGKDDLLRWLAKDTTLLCGTFQQYKMEYEEDMPKLGIKKPLIMK
jgi:hypothetical protein